MHAYRDCSSMSALVAFIPVSAASVSTSTGSRAQTAVQSIRRICSCSSGSCSSSPVAAFRIVVYSRSMSACREPELGADMRIASSRSRSTIVPFLRMYRIAVAAYMNRFFDRFASWLDIRLHKQRLDVMQRAHRPTVFRLSLDPMADVRLGPAGDEELERQTRGDSEEYIKDFPDPV
ncbi:hypothetical protein AG1IA_10180 [Rhizoctonia solani AG-1 IA]|uniref:Uncharacterized protein n=1 Tax=Thanatephorus cucumeris (strain AG1-IA) TaxID=983506 RepID=L8WCX9_THACA|nr:hypothetical protein AG1IA_10180 [Rhizoctonia solani AG-1 IA]